MELVIQSRIPWRNASNVSLELFKELSRKKMFLEKQYCSLPGGRMYNEFLIDFQVFER